MTYSIPNKIGRPATRAMVIRQVLSEWTGPIGMSHAELTSATRINANVLCALANELRKADRIFSLGEFKDRRFFPSAEARDAAAPAYEATMAVVKEQRQQATLEKNRRARRKYCAAQKHLRAARGTAPAKPTAEKVSPIRMAIIDVLTHSTCPIGVSSHEIAAATGFRWKQVSLALCRLRHNGLAFHIGEQKDRRYFATAEARDAAAVPYKVFLHGVRQERIARAKATALKGARKSYEAKREMRLAAQPKPEPKPPKPAPKAKAAPKPKHRQQPIKLAKAKSVKPTVKSFKDMPVVNAGAVKVKVLPGFTGDRFAVSGPVIGGFASMGLGRYLEAA